MAKVRVYELAKELGLTSKEFIEFLAEEFDLTVSSHMAVLEGDTLELIKEFFEESSEEINNDANEDVVEEEITEDYEEYNDKYSNKDEFKKSKKKEKKKQNKVEENKEVVEDTGVVYVHEGMTIKEFSEAIKKPVTQVIGSLMKMGVMSNMNQPIDLEHAMEIAFSYNILVEEKVIEPELDEHDIERLDFEDKPEDLVERAPIVTVMGHVDHGKTSLLDKMRGSRVASGEAGGITQHIGASHVYVDGKKVVFLDTPGHEAFTQMRSRGANTTDIAVLVVAADDGVMPQTVEAINHAKAANVPIIVAINKMDKYEANPDKVKSELAEYGLTPEDWGGSTIMVPVSAHTGEGVDDLLENILLVAEVEELKANPNRPAVGVVIEAQLDKGRGPVATVLINKGTLNQGDFIVSGSSVGKVRAMFDSNQKQVKKAKPSTAVLVLGLSEVPEAGDKIYAVNDEKLGKKFAERQKQLDKAEFIKRTSKVNLDQLFNKLSEGEMKDLNVIVKTDVKGTIDAVSSSLLKLSNEEVRVNVIHGAVGGITESDVMLASASGAIIIGFNVRPNQGAKTQAEEQGIEIRTYRVIYEAIEDIQKAIKGMLAPKFVEQVIGSADVREVFRVPNIGNIAGIMVTNGQMQRNAKIRLLRDNVVIHEGEISSLKRYKDDVKELNQGYEGGLGIQNYNDIKVGDTLEAFIDKEVER